MVVKKRNSTNKSKTKSKTSKKRKSKTSKSDSSEMDTGIVIVDDDLIRDRESELEERRAFLEEAKSQEASSD